MSQLLEEKKLEDWAEFNFTDVDEPPAPPSPVQSSPPVSTSSPDEERDTEEAVQEQTEEDKQVSLPDAFEEDARAEQKSKIRDESTAPPAYQGLEIPIAEIPMYKRPHMKAVFYGSFVLVAVTALGAILTRGANVEIGNAPNKTVSPKQATEKSQAELDAEKRARLEGDVAFSTLKNRAALLEEQKKQKILSGKLSKQEEENAKQAPSNTVKIPSRSTRSTPVFSRSTPPRIPISVSPRIPSTPPRIASVSVPPAPAPRQFSSRSSAPVPQKNEVPTVVSFGAMPDSNQSNDQGFNRDDGFQTVAQRESNDLNSSLTPSDDVILAQQEQAFLEGKPQVLVESGQSVLGEVTRQVIADSDAVFNIRTREAVLGLPVGTDLLAQVTQFADGYIEAEAVAVLNKNGDAIPIPSKAVQISSPNGKLLKAKTNKSFFQTGFGQALLGAGRGIADQYTSRSETFFQTESSTTITRGSGSQNLASLGSSALKGLADPLLDQGSNASGSSAQLLNPGTKVKLNIYSSFVVSQ